MSNTEAKTGRQKNVRIGIMGTGWVATMRHLPALKRDKRVILSAVYNPIGNLAEQTAKKYEIPNFFTDLEHFLKQPLDAVVICTPPMTHAELIEKSLLAGKHVLSEKPLTVKAEDGQRLAELAREKNLILCPAHNFVFGRAVAKADACIRKSKLGDVIGAMGIQWSSHKRLLPTWYPELPGGLFFDEGPHLVYLLQHFLGPLEVEDAWYDKRRVAETPFEQFEARLKGKNSYATVSAWFGAPMSEWLMIISGTRGTIVLDIFRDTAIYYPAEGERDPKYLMRVLLNGDRQIWGGMMRWIFTRYTKGSHLFGLEELTHKFIDAVLHENPPPVSAEEGWQVIRVLEDIVNKSGAASKPTQ